MEKPMTDLVARAHEFARKAHESVNQRRKYTDEPYIVHPEEVASIVATVPHTDAMLAAAYLHDVVEDTGVTADAIRAEFGDEVADLVGWLTDVSTKADGNRKVRKEKDRQHTASAPPAAKTVKLADLISNSDSITRYDPHFSKLYMSEKKALLEVLGDGDPTLHARATAIVEAYYAAQKAAV